MERVGAERSERRGPGVQARHVLVPRLHGVWLVEPHAERDLLPKPLDVRLAEDLRGPALVRRADPAPVDRVLPMLALDHLRDLHLDRPADTFTVEIGEQPRVGAASRPDGGVAGRLQRQLLFPRGRVCERGVRTELDHRAPEVVVAVDDVDVRRACPVRLPDDRATELPVLHHRVDEDLLARLHVRADANGELGVALEPLVGGRHASCHSSFRISGTSAPSASTASTSSSGPPTMKSTWMLATLNPPSGSPSTRKGRPAPYAT